MKNHFYPIITGIALLCGISFSVSADDPRDYQVPVKKPFLGKHHWSLRPDVVALGRMSDQEHAKMMACAGAVGGGMSMARNVYKYHVEKGNPISELMESYAQYAGYEGYQITPRKSIDEWRGESGEELIEVLDKIELDLGFGYYESHYPAESYTKENTVIAEVIWDYCIDIPMENFPVDG